MQCPCLHGRGAVDVPRFPPVREMWLIVSRGSPSCQSTAFGVALVWHRCDSNLATTSPPMLAFRRDSYLRRQKKYAMINAGITK